MGLLKAIIYILVFYFLFKLVFRIVVPYVLKTYLQKNQQQFYDANGNPQMKTKKQGDVTIEYEQDKKNKSKQSGGDYVDYEEIK